MNNELYKGICYKVFDGPFNDADLIRLTDTLVYSTPWIMNNSVIDYNSPIGMNRLHTIWGVTYKNTDTDKFSKNKFIFHNDPAWVNKLKKYIYEELLDCEFSIAIQHCGLNGQTLGQDGVIHQDGNGLTFLYYIQYDWKNDYGGDLIFFDDNDIEIDRVKFQPGKIIMFDSHIKHRAMAPINTNKMRISLVIRGPKNE